jgi:hypothetical protein
MVLATSPDHPARLRLAGGGEFGAGFSQKVEPGLFTEIGEIGCVRLKSL